MTRVFVTGVSGQDGSYLAERMVAEGAEVHALVQSTDRAGISGVIEHVGDLRDVSGTRAIVHAVEPDEIYNLAALSSVGLSWEQPELTAQINGVGAAALMESAWQVQEQSGHPVRFLQASSAEIFGHTSQVPQTEATPIQPVNPYGASKAYAHLMVEVYRQRGLTAASAILYNHESPRRPERFVTRKITAAAARIAQGRQQVLRLGNLDARRDWGWAPDYVDAMVRANRANYSTDCPASFVVATGRSHSVRDFAAAAFASVGIADWESYVEIDESLVRPSDPAEQVGDATRARKELGWAPSVDFVELVGRMVEADLQQFG